MNIDAATDPWIPKEGSCKPTITQRSIAQATVAQLIDNQGRWKEELIRTNFMEEDAEIILNIPINSSPREDTVIWQKDSKGLFSVRSAYRLGIHLSRQNEASASSYQEMESKWNFFWKTKLPPKIKICGYSRPV